MSIAFITFWVGGMCASGGNVLCELKHGTLGFAAEVTRKAYPVRFAVCLGLMVLFWPASLVAIYQGSGSDDDDDEGEAEA